VADAGAPASSIVPAVTSPTAMRVGNEVTKSH
jgi:hypothetical protein